MLLISRRYLSVFSVISMFLVLHFFQCSSNFRCANGKSVVSENHHIVELDA